MTNIHWHSTFITSDGRFSMRRNVLFYQQQCWSNISLLLLSENFPSDASYRIRLDWTIALHSNRSNRSPQNTTRDFAPLYLENSQYITMQYHLLMHQEFLWYTWIVSQLVNHFLIITKSSNNLIMCPSCCQFHWAATVMQQSSWRANVQAWEPPNLRWK